VEYDYRNTLQKIFNKVPFYRVPSFRTISVFGAHIALVNRILLTVTLLPPYLRLLYIDSIQ